MSREDFVKFWRFMKIFMPKLEVKYKEFPLSMSIVFISNKYYPLIKYVSGKITYIMDCIKCNAAIIDTNENPIHALGYCLECGAKVIEELEKENEWLNMCEDWG